MADLPRPVLARSSPAIRAHAARRIMLVLCGVLLAGALLVVVFNLDGPENEEIARPDDPRQIEEYLPQPFTGEGAPVTASQDPQVIFESGAWIEVADAEGRLVQMYRAERLEPQPEEMIDLLEPVAVMFLSGGRVVTLEGNFCRAKRRSESDIIESGRISGDVRIRMFDPEGEALPRYATAPPSVYIETEDATFDNISGEITCPGEVLVRTDSFEFYGRDLLTRYDQENGLQFLRAAETLRPIRIASRAVERTSESPAEPLEESIVENVWPKHLARTQDEAADDGTQERPRRRRERTTGDAAPGMQLYRATFEDNVHIWRGHDEEAEAGQVILGDQLRAVFTLESSGLGGAEPRITRADFSGASAGSAARFVGEWRSFVAISTYATVQDELPVDRDAILPPPRAEDLRITHDGPLTIVPIDEPGITLANEDDVHLEIVGLPARLVDRTAEAAAESGLITYEAAADRAELVGMPEAPLHFASPELVADGERFVYEFAEDRAAFIGPGTMQMYRVEGITDPPAGAMVAEAALDKPQRTPTLAMAWTEGVDLRLTPQPDDEAADHESRLEEAIFRGGVTATEERFAMSSHRLRVDFDSASDARDEIELIEAAGAVDVRGLDARGGRMTADDMRIDFEPNGDSGRRRPRTMTATGNAHLEDPTQQIDARVLVAHFVPVEAAGDDASAASSNRFGEAEVDVFTANDNVRIVLDDGTRATGDQFTARVRENIADLVGAPVVIDGGDEDVEFHAEGDAVHIERLADGRSELTMTDEVVARIVNRGPARGFEGVAGDLAAAPPEEPQPPEAPAPGADQPAEAPAASPQVIDVSCTERLVYLEGAPAEPGQPSEADVLELFGTVRAKSTAALEDSSVEGEYLRLDFEDEPVVVEAGAPADGAAGEPADAAAPAPAETRRTLRRMIAKGDAQLESRSWLTPAREESGLRIVYISGHHVEYDQRSMTVDVPGAGELLILDHRVDEDAPASASAGEADQPAGDRGLSGKGDTLFRWQKSMRMQQVEEGLYSMHLEDDAVMLHKSLLGVEHDASLTTPVLDVVFGRRGPEAQASALDFGGAMELRRFETIGPSRLVAMQKEIDASRIIYDAAGQIAEIFGTRANPAEIMVTGARAPQRAEKFIWDLRQDKVTIIRAVGGASQ